MKGMDCAMMDDEKREVAPDDETMEPGGAGAAAKWTVDSIQGSHALVTDGKNQVALPVEMLPKGVQPGDPLDDEIGSVLTNDPSGDKNMAEQEPDADDTMEMGGKNSRARMAGYDDDEDDVQIKPTQPMTRMR